MSLGQCLGKLLGNETSFRGAVLNEQMIVAASGDADTLVGCRVIALLNNHEIFGQEKANIEVFKTLRDQGAVVTVGVTSLDQGGLLRQRVGDLGFEMFSLPFGRQWSKYFFRRKPSLFARNILSVARCSRVLAQQIRRRDATHVHIGNPLVYSYVAPSLRMNRKIRFVYRMGDEPPHDSWPNLMIWKSCFSRADCVVANSKFVRTSILKAVPGHEQKLNLIYNMTSLPCAHIHSHEESPIPDDFRLLFVGQLATHKGVEHLLEAAFRLMKRSLNLRLDIVGGSVYSEGYRQAVQSLVCRSGFENRITFHGYMEDPMPLYKQADLLVVPSLFEEPAANVALEAKRLGVPSVVYPSGGLPELVIHGENGFVCREKSVDALVEGIQWFLNEPDRLGAARQSALDDSQARFGEERFAQQWASIYSEGRNKKGAE